MRRFIQIFIITFICLCAMRACAVTEAEVLDVAQVAYAECLSESPEGRAAMVNVVMERACAPGFPHTLAGVLHQRCAFSCTLGGGSRLYRKAKGFTAQSKDAQWQQILKEVRITLGQSVPAKAQGVIFYKEIHVLRFPGMSTQPVLAFRIGAHDFYRMAS